MGWDVVFLLILQGATGVLVWRGEQGISQDLHDPHKQPTCNLHSLTPEEPGQILLHSIFDTENYQRGLLSTCEMKKPSRIVEFCEPDFAGMIRYT